MAIVTTSVSPGAAAGLGQAARGTSSPLRERLRRLYWRMRAAQAAHRRARTMRTRLSRLRRRARSATRMTPGVIRLDDDRIAYDDLLALYFEYKHIFDWGIYDFSPSAPRPTVIDGGSHIGLSVLRFKRICPDCRVVAFEPSAQVRGLLEENISQNGLTDVTVVPAALAATAGHRRFIDSAADGGTLVGAAAACETQQVKTVRLSDYLDRPIEMLKLNIEGSECDVLHEAEDKLGCVRRMVVEYHGFAELDQTLHRILALLDRRGFRYILHHFDDETNPSVAPPFRPLAATRFFVLIAAEHAAAVGEDS